MAASSLLKFPPRTHTFHPYPSFRRWLATSRRDPRSISSPPHPRPPPEPPFLDLSYPAYMIWGANTNVGKTLVSAGLAASIICRNGLGAAHALHGDQGRVSSDGFGAADTQERVHGGSKEAHSRWRALTDVLYVKPVQTGFPGDSDSDFVARKVSEVLLSSSSATPNRVFISNYTQKASPAVVCSTNAESDSRNNVGTALLPQLDRITIKQVESGGMKDLCSYDGHVLEAEEAASGFRQKFMHPESSRDAGLAKGGSSVTVSNLTCTTMWSWHNAVSPHLAAAEEGCIVSDSSVLESLRRALWNFQRGLRGSEIGLDDLKGNNSWALVETAGGVASPGPSGTLQCDLYRPLRLPGLLVGDGKLGGISSTITAYESLQLRGYDVAAIVLTDTGLANDKFLISHLDKRVPVLILPSIPEDPNDNLVGWFLQSGEVFSTLQEVLETAHMERIQRLEEMPKKALQLLWWPFTQHSLVPEDTVTLIDSRCGENFTVSEDNKNGKVMRQQFDACASWWTQGPDAKLQTELAKQIAYTAGRFGHVMLPENVHEPALRCAELLLDGMGKGWAHRVYYSDNGSTAIEIAIKMAFRKFLSDHNLLRNLTLENFSAAKEYDLKVLALRGSYHGDTLGAQDSQAPSAYTGFLQQPWYQGRGLFLDPPHIYLQNGKWHLQLPNCCENKFEMPVESSWTSRDAFFQEEREKTALAKVYKDYILEQLLGSLSSEVSTRIAALIIEPVIHGAGGMHLIDPLFQRVLVKECRARMIPVIFDEVLAGCWRLGVQSASELIGCIPDIGCYSKLLTGGAVPLAATLASRPVFEAFKGQSKLFALLHGHSYSGHAIGCHAAVTSLQWFKDPMKNPNLLPCGGRLKELWDAGIVCELSAHPAVHRVISLGTIFALELKVDTLRAGYGSMSAKEIVKGLRTNGVFVRPLGNVVYLMCGPATSPSVCSKLLWTLHKELDLYLKVE